MNNKNLTKIGIVTHAAIAFTLMSCLLPIQTNAIINKDQPVYLQEDGTVLLTDEFVEASWIDIESYIQEEFEYQGYVFNHFKTNSNTEVLSDTKFFTHEEEIILEAKTENAAKTEIMSLIELTWSYEEDGYFGELEVKLDSITYSPRDVGYSTSTKTTTKAYQSSFNDDSIIPDTIEEDGATWNFVSRTWDADGMMDDASVPDSYTATAVYSRNVGYQTVGGYTAYVTYEGILEKVNNGDTTYAITYRGVPVENGEDELFEVKVSTKDSSAFSKITDFLSTVFSSDSSELSVESSNITMGNTFESTTTEGGFQPRGELESNLNKFLTLMSIIIAGLVMVAFTFSLILKTLGNLSKNNNKVAKAIIMARDEYSGVEKKIQKVKISAKRPVVTVNYGKAPQSKHFKILLKPNEAEKLSGKRVTINVGSEVQSHLISQSHNNDYIIPIEWNG